jgi:hypothetical protein
MVAALWLGCIGAQQKSPQRGNSTRATAARGSTARAAASPTAATRPARARPAAELAPQPALNPLADLPDESWNEPSGADAADTDADGADPALAREDCAAVPYELRKDELDVNNDGCRYNLGVTSACVEDFWQRVRRTFAEKDVSALVALTDDNFRVNLTPRKRQKLRPSNPKRLAARLFTDQIRERLAHADPRLSMCSFQGTMIDNGLLWADVSPSDGQLRLRVLNQTSL